MLMVITNMCLLKMLLISPVEQRKAAVAQMETAVSFFNWNPRFDSKNGHGWHLENDNRQWKLVRNSRQILDYRDEDWTVLRVKRVSGISSSANDDENDTAKRLTDAGDETLISGGRLVPPSANYQRHHQQGANQPTTAFTVTNGGTSDGLEIALGYGPLLGLNCTAFSNISAVQLVSAGWTKAVYKGKYKKQDIAVKEVNLYGHDMSACLKQTGVTFWDCYKKSAAKILKEIVLLKDLGHPNLLKVSFL